MQGRNARPRDEKKQGREDGPSSPKREELPDEPPDDLPVVDDDLDRLIWRAHSLGERTAWRKG